MRVEPSDFFNTKKKKSVTKPVPAQVAIALAFITVYYFFLKLLFGI